MRGRSVEAGGRWGVSGQPGVALQRRADVVLSGGDDGPQQPDVMRPAVGAGVINAAQLGGEVRPGKTMAPARSKFR
ncbi:hypothetical protein GCM10010429_45170 [Micromonospora olivasterospora]